METVLVTGGAGFIGSHICKALAAHGFLPVAFNDLSRGHADFVRWGPLVNGDILDPSRAQCGLRVTSPRRRHPFRRSSLCRRIDVAASPVLPGQRPGQRSRGDAASRNPHHRVLEFVRNLWHPDRLPIPENAPQRSVRGSKLAGKQILWPTRDLRFQFFLLSSFTISWRDRILTSFLSNLRSFLIKKNSYSWPHLKKQIDVPRVAFNVTTGEVEGVVGNTRTEKDFTRFLRQLLSSAAPTTKWDIVCDNLNIHVSESVVRLVARVSGLKLKLGIKGKSGVLACKAIQ